MPGIAPLGKLFFSSFFERFLDKILPVGKQEPLCLCVSRACRPWES